MLFVVSAAIDVKEVVLDGIFFLNMRVTLSVSSSFASGGDSGRTSGGPTANFGCFGIALNYPLLTIINRYILYEAVLTVVPYPYRNANRLFFEELWTS